jgi:acyl carrier protein
MSVFEQIKQAIHKTQPGIDENKIVPSALLKDDLAIDSLGQVELALALEDTFELSLSDAELDDTATVSDLVSLIESSLKKQND